MTANIIKLKPSNEDLMEFVFKENPEEIIMITYKEGTYSIYNTSIKSIRHTLGSLEVLKYEILSGGLE